MDLEHCFCFYAIHMDHFWHLEVNGIDLEYCVLCLVNGMDYYVVGCGIALMPGFESSHAMFEIVACFVSF